MSKRLIRVGNGTGPFTTAPVRLAVSTISSADEFDKMKCAEMVSEAYIYKKDKNFLYTFSSYQKNDVGFGDRNIIPLGCVQKIEKKTLS